MAERPKGGAGTLGRLRTELGERSTYDAASQCSRCGYCEQACPTYVVTGEEPKSGRGRNQLVRMMLEGKLRDPGTVREALSTCLLCGACTTACYAHVPTADLVLEGRRALREGRTPRLMNVLEWLLERRPGLLARLLKAANLLKRAGATRFVSRSRVLRLFGLRGLEEADRRVDEAPLRFLFERLRDDDGLRAPARGPSRGAWAYFAPCGPNYLYPRVGLATVSVLKRALGTGVFLDNPCCGLLFYNYGDVEAARRMARRNIENCGAKAAPGTAVYADCSSCAAHLKSYPQLFLEEPEWKARAEAFARSVRDVVELEPDRLAPPPPEPLRVPWTYHDSCRARHGEGLAAEPRSLLRAACGEGCRELPEPGWCCGGAGAFAFAEPELSDAVLRRKIGHIASTGARLVATSSTSCLLQIADGLKKYYPECRVVHVSELLEGRLDGGASRRGPAAAPASPPPMARHG